MSRRRSSSPAGTRGAPAAATPLLRVAFLHPDLGLGGAERLVVDAAAGLRRLGHGVEVFTSHYEPARSFAETRSGAFPVHVHGDWLPRAVLGRLHILCALLRMLWLALRVALRAGAFDVLIVDQVSACVPLLKLLCPRAKVLFYCASWRARARPCRARQPGAGTPLGAPPHATSRHACATPRRPLPRPAAGAARLAPAGAVPRAL